MSNGIDQIFKHFSSPSSFFLLHNWTLLTGKNTNNRKNLIQTFHGCSVIWIRKNKFFFKNKENDSNDVQENHMMTKQYDD